MGLAQVRPHYRSIPPMTSFCSVLWLISIFVLPLPCFSDIPNMQESCVILKLFNIMYPVRLMNSKHLLNFAPTPSLKLFPENCNYCSRKIRKESGLLSLYNKLILTWSDSALLLFCSNSTDSSQGYLFLSVSLFEDTVNPVNNSVSLPWLLKRAGPSLANCQNLGTAYLLLKDYTLTLFLNELEIPPLKCVLQKHTQNYKNMYV